jgi:hypothetical protein
MGCGDAGGGEGDVGMRTLGTRGRSSGLRLFVTASPPDLRRGYASPDFTSVWATPLVWALPHSIDRIINSILKDKVTNRTNGLSPH